MAKRTAQEKIELSKRICDKYATGLYTIESCCESEGISARQFENYCNDISEVSAFFKIAKEDSTNRRKGELKHCALSSLKKLIEGHTFDEVSQEGTPIYGENGEQVGMKIKGIKRTKKYFPPNVTAVIFALKALEPTTYRDGLPDVNNEPQTFLINGQLIKF